MVFRESFRNSPFLKTTKKLLDKGGGAYFSKERKSWLFNIFFQEYKKRIIKRGFKTKLDAQIARDLEVIKLFKLSEAKLMLVFPENLEKYLSGEIKYPKRKFVHATKRSKYSYVQFNTKYNSWVAVINHNNKLIKKGSFLDEIDAAKTADFLNIKYKNAERKTLNFPENYDNYLSLNFKLPNTIHINNKKVKNTYIKLHNNEYCVIIRRSKRSDFEYYKYGISTEEEALNIRNDILTKNNIPIPYY